MSAQQPLILFICVTAVTSLAQAETQPSGRPTASPFVDVALQPAGGVAGRFVDGNGDPIAGARASLVRGESLVETTYTQPDGTYRFASAVPGVYRVNLDGQWSNVRVWDASTRPPAATEWLTIVKQATIVRGQPIRESLVGQIGLGIGIASAVGAGIAINESLDAQKETADLRRLLKVSSP